MWVKWVPPRCRDSCINIVSIYALRALRSKIRNFKDCRFQTVTKLYHTCVEPILDYGSGVWGYNRFSKTETIHNRALRYFLGVHRFAPNHAIQHTMDMLWEKFQWILPLYMKPIDFQSKASVVCSVTAAVSIDFCLKKLNVFSQHIGKKTNEYLNSTEQIPRNWIVDQLSMLITS